MALAHSILGKFLWVVCHCLPTPLDVPTFAARCLYVRNKARDFSSERWNYEREMIRQFCLNSDFHINLGIFYMPQIYDIGPTSLLPLWKKACWGFFRPKIPTASVGFEAANLGTEIQHDTPRPPKPLIYIYMCVLLKYNFVLNCKIQFTYIITICTIYNLCRFNLHRTQNQINSYLYIYI